MLGPTQLEDVIPDEPMFTWLPVLVLAEALAAWENHTNQYPERSRAAPRTQPDGTWAAGDHRRLSPEQNAEAGKAHADLADEADRDILPALQRIEVADPHRHLAGLDHMIKGEDRLKEKLADYLRTPGVTVREALGEVPDAVRFTLCYGAEHYSDGVLADIERLKDEGYELIKLKNIWHADQYKGINSQWLRPETGTRFEMQFHTPLSLEAKELTAEKNGAVTVTFADGGTAEGDLAGRQPGAGRHHHLPPQRALRREARHVRPDAGGRRAAPVVVRPSLDTGGAAAGKAPCHDP